MFFFNMLSQFLFLLLCNDWWVRHCQYPHCQIWRQPAPSFVLFAFSPMYRQWETGGETQRERERETFWLFEFTLKYGKGPIAEQREDKLSGDLPSRSSLDRLDVILFNLSTSSRHKEDRTGLTRCHRAAPSAYLCSLTFRYVKYKASAHMQLVPNTIYLHSVETRSAYKTVSCSFSSCELSSLKQAICFRAALLRVFVWIKAEGPLYLLATVATNTEVCSLLPSEERRWKGERRKPRNDPNIRLNSEIEGKTRHQSP